MAANAIAEANRRAEQAEIEARRKVEQEAINQANEEARLKAEEEVKAKNKDHQAKIHNQILIDLKDVGITFDDGTVSDETVGYDLAKEIVKAIVKDKIRNLKITY